MVPIQYSYMREAEPAAATERPPRKGPISRHLSAEKALESNALPSTAGACAPMRWAGRAANARAAMRIATPANMERFTGCSEEWDRNNSLPRRVGWRKRQSADAPAK